MKIFGYKRATFNIRIKGCLLFASVFALTALSAHAQCGFWNTWYPAWSLTQSDKTRVYLQTTRGEGAAIVGTASYTDNYTSRKMTGTIEGMTQGNDFTLQIFWKNGQVGVYNGQISNTGRIEGTGFAKSNPGHKITWFSDTALKCATEESETDYREGGDVRKHFSWPSIRAANGELVLLDFCHEWAANCGEPVATAFCKSKGFSTSTVIDTEKNVGRTAVMSNGRICTGPACVGIATIFCRTLPAQPATAPPKKTIKMTGKPRVPDSPPPAVPQPTAPADAVPMIRALPNNVIVRTPEGLGKTTLTWDGGPDHPYAEVWVKIDDADETFVVEQGKGSRQVTVEAGKTYIYILTDAGKTLATVKVKFRQGGPVRPVN